MTRPILYLFVGYPGAGKTTVSKIIEASTGATHLWADHIRRELFTQPNHTPEESHVLYSQLNQRASEALAAGESVIYDTNFNFRSDREAMRNLAAARGATAKLIWITTPVEIACRRAVETPGAHGTRVLGEMSQADFDAIVAKLEPPTEDENPLKIDGTELDVAALKRHLNM